MDKFTLPTFFCPFPSQINPQVDQLQARSLEWVQNLQLVQKESAVKRFNAMRFSWLVARVYATQPVADIELADDWQTWMFLLDDQFDEGVVGRQPEQMQAVLSELQDIVLQPCTTTPTTPIARGLMELWQRTIPMMNAYWLDRLTKHLLNYFRAYGWETQNRAQLSIPDIETYIQNRRNSGAMFFVFDITELVERLDIPPHAYECEELQAALRAANNLVCWINDIFSVSKERARGDVNNFVIVAQHTYNLNLQEAVNFVNDRITDEMKFFIETSQHLPTFSPEIDRDMQRYIEVLQAWIRGIIDWSLETQRYSQVEETAPGEKVSYLEDIV